MRGGIGTGTRGGERVGRAGGGLVRARKDPVGLGESVDVDTYEEADK